MLIAKYDTINGGHNMWIKKNSVLDTSPTEVNLSITLKGKPADRLINLYLKGENIESHYEDAMKEGLEEYATRMLIDDIRARNNYYNELGLGIE